MPSIFPAVIKVAKGQPLRTLRKTINRANRWGQHNPRLERKEVVFDEYVLVYVREEKKVPLEILVPYKDHWETIRQFHMDNFRKIMEQDPAPLVHPELDLTTVDDRLVRIVLWEVK